ncbi:MAG: MFS transporter [Cyanobacteria bacterium P01_A01_bin.37]
MGEFLGQPSLFSQENRPGWLYNGWLVCICGGMLVYFTQVTVLFPVLPLYLSQQRENTPIGLVVGALAAGLLFFRPSIGWLIDHWGRKPVLWTGLAIMLVILPVYSWAPTTAWLLGVRILHGISQAAFATASQTMLADLVPPNRRTAMLGYLGMSNTIGFSIGPALGAWLFDTRGFESVITLQIGLTILGVLISLPLPWLKATTPVPDSSQQTVSSPANLSSNDGPQRDGARHAAPHTEQASKPEHSFPWKIVTRFPVRDATFIFFVGSFLHGGVVTFLPLFVSNSAIFFSLNALVAIFVRFALGRWGHRVSKQWVVSLGIFCSGSALVGMALTQSAQHSGTDNSLILWSILYGIGFGSLFPVLSAIVSLAAPVAVRGRVYSVFLAGFDGGMTLGGAGIQLLVQAFPLDGLFLMLGCVGWGASAIAFRQFSKPVAIAQNTNST